VTAHWPDFYIVGAPKAGTTSLYEYLAAYPEVFLPKQKELRFFGSDLDVRHRRVWTTEEFLDLYRDAPPGSLRGGAYVWYLFSRAAGQEIGEVRPDARIVIALRNPSAALYALHSEFVFDGNEDLEDFADALAAEPDRCAGRRIPAEAHFPAGLCYRATVRYAEQVERYLDRFGSDQVHVLLFDDLIEQPEATCTALARFLGLSPRPEIPLPRANPNKRARSALMRRFLAVPPPSLRRAMRAAVPAPLRRLAYRRAVALNSATPERPALTSELRDQLRAELDPEVVKLERLLGRSLPAWRAPS
jgi:Sulfotransferase family